VSFMLKKGDRVLLPKCKVALSFCSRFLGLMGRKELPADEAVIFPKCSSIHTFFMRMPIDVVFVSASGEVVHQISALQPWKLLLPVKKAAHTIEMASQTASKLEIRLGDKLSCPGVFG